MWSRLFGGPRHPPALDYSLDPTPARTPIPRRLSTHQQKMIRSFGKKGSAKGCFNMPTGVAVTAMGDLVVVDSENSRLQVFTPDGHLRIQIGEKGCLPHQLNHPMALTLSKDGDENIMVTDSVNASVKVFMQDGTFVTQYGGSGMFDYPYGVSVTSNHHLVVSDVCQHSIMVLYPSGSRRTKFGKYGDGPNNLDHPYSIAVDTNDHILVADSGNTCIKRYTLDGGLLQCFGLKDFRLYNEHFVLLAGINVDAEDNVIVVGNSTIYIVAPNGRFWEAVLPAEGLHSPKAVAYSALGYLVVTQCGLDNRHEVGLFSYNPQDYKSLHSVPRVMVQPELSGSMFRVNNSCSRTKRHSAPCRTNYTSLEDPGETNRNNME